MADKPPIVATSLCPSEPLRQSPGRPLMVVVGASFTAGVGASSPTASWAYLLAGYLGWRAVSELSRGLATCAPAKMAWARREAPGGS